MVHKKYTYKDGKRYGPYYYETKRVNGRVVTRYLGTDNPKRNKNINFPLSILGFGVIAVLLLLFFLFPFSSTGRVALDIDNNYVSGEIIGGSLALSLKEGELVPASSLISVNYGGINRDFLLSDLIDAEIVEGDFFVEGSNITGFGDGIGFIGSREKYPVVSFEFIVKDSVSSGSSGSSEEDSEIVEGNDAEQEDAAVEQNVSEESQEETPSDEDNVDSDEELEVPEDLEGPDSDSSSGEEVSSPESEESEEDSEVSGNEESSDSPEESDSGSDDGGSSDSPAGITGAVISESSISGEVSGDREFIYYIGEGQDIEIVEGSVRVDDVVISESFLDIEIVDGELIITTDYSLSDEGFGSEFLGDEEIIEIDFENFELNASESGDINIGISYDDRTFVEVSRTIVVDELGNEIITSNETVISNETEANQTVVNDTRIEVNTSQFGAVLGQPVRWQKKLSLENSSKLSVELPSSVSNVSVKRVVKEQLTEDKTRAIVKYSDGSEEEIESEEDVSDDSGFSESEGELRVSLTGQVSAELQLEKERNGFLSRILDFFEITGFVVSGEEEGVIVEVNESVKEVVIEYETPAPYSEEMEIEFGKIVKIVSPEDIHYENVLAFTEISEGLELRNNNSLKVYWEENKTYVPVYSISDLDSNGIYDYVEWVAPHLSNQTFTIIVITEADHLDENREFISDIYQEVKELDGVWSQTINSGEYVRVTFERNLTSSRDITVYPRIINGAPRIEIYEINGGEVVAEFDSLLDESYNKVFLFNLEGSQDKFDLRVLNGEVQFDHILDPTVNYWIAPSHSTRTFDDPTAWSLGSVPVAGEDVIINSTGPGTMNITNNTLPQDLNSWTVESSYSGEIYFNSLFAEGDWTGDGIGTQEWNVTNNITINGGTLYIYGDYPFNITDEGHGQIWRSDNASIVVGSGATLDGEALGFPAQAGPGSISTAGGGTHGGKGVANSEFVYGNLTAPTSLGSGGDDRAGGSGIKLIASEMVEVDGTIDMSGSETSDNDGMGAGGSIWLIGETVDGSGVIDASGGATTGGSSGARNGGGGRIRLGYLDTLDFNGTIYVGGSEGAQGRASAGTLTLTNSTWQGDWIVKGDLGLAGGDYGEGDVFNVLGDFIVQEGANLSAFGDCVFDSDNPVSCYNDTEEGKGVWINSSGDIFLSEDSSVLGNEFGFPLSTGPGSDSAGRGASHGGLGGQASASTYGSETYPISLGSGGGGAAGDPGGSAIRFQALGNVSLNGIIDMGVEDSSNNHGAGGSILAIGDNVNGSGTLIAKGGSSGGSQRGGGGGRVALHGSTVSFSGSINVSGGTSGSSNTNRNGGGGTVFINATNSITDSANIESVGYDGGTINFTDTLLTISGFYNATTLNETGYGGDGTITTNYTSCSSSFGGTSNPERVDEGPECTGSDPDDPSPSINSTDGSNLTGQDLNGFATITDDDGDSLNVSVRWYKDGVLNFSQDFNNSYSNGTLFVATLDSENTTKDEAWTFSIRVFDGTAYSDWVNSSDLTILNTLPTVTLDTPSDASTTTNRTPTFAWTGSDDDGDTIGYEFNISLVANSLCAESDRHIQGLNNENYTLQTDLKCLYDNADYYLWQVRANDSDGFGDWTDQFAINLTSLVQLTLPSSSVDFGELGLQQSNNTSDDSPSPFVIRNDGNVLTNVTLNASNLWNSVDNPSTYFRFKADNVTGEEGAFVWPTSVTSFTNVPNASALTTFLVDFNYTDSADSAEIDLFVQVPPNEPPSTRSSTLVFIGSSTE